MEATLGTQNQSLLIMPTSGTSSHSRRRRRRLGDLYVVHRDRKPRNFVVIEQGSLLLAPQRTPESVFLTHPHISKLDRLKALHFTAFGRRNRIQRSLDALHKQSTLHLTVEDWHWLDENAALEDEFE